MRKVKNGQADYYTTGCLSELIVIHSSLQQVLDVDPKANQKIALHKMTWNWHWAGNTTMLFIIEHAKESLSYFLQGTLKE